MNYTTQYINILKALLEDGYWYDDPNREGVKRKELFGVIIRHNMMETFPLLTTKKVWTRGVWAELKWMLSGSKNIQPMVASGLNIWNKDAYNYYLKMVNKYETDNPTLLLEPMNFRTFEDRLNSNNKTTKLSDVMTYRLGDIGPMYPTQWRKQKIDQIVTVIEKLRKNPFASDLIVSAWNPNDLEDMALKPCHHEMQFNCREFEDELYLDLSFTMRSSDFLLGQPWNMAFYGYLLILISQLTNTKPGELIYHGRKTHLYNNQIKAAEEQIAKYERLVKTGMLQEPTVTSTTTSFQEDVDMFKNGDLTFDQLLESVSDTDFNMVGYKHAGKLHNQPEMLAYDAPNLVD